MTLVTASDVLLTIADKLTERIMKHVGGCWGEEAIKLLTIKLGLIEMVEKQKTWTSLILYNDAKVLVADIIYGDRRGIFMCSVSMKWSRR